MGLAELPATWAPGWQQKQTQEFATASSTGAPQAYLTVNANTSPFKLVFTTSAGFVAIHLRVVVAVVGMAVAIASCKYKATLAKPPGPLVTS